MKTILAALFAIVAAFSLGGCVGGDHDPMMATPGTGGVTVSPSDGEANVRLDAGVTLTFVEPVDRSVTEADFHLISESAMADSTCPVNAEMGHGDMGFAMGDSSMMAHVNETHGVPGRFLWNGDSTQCSFLPDSMMAPSTRYMIHLGGRMMQMMEERMGGSGPMGGHGTGMMAGQMMLHFRTIDTTVTGSGHDGHH